MNSMPECDWCVAASVVEEEGVSDLQQVEHRDEEAHVVHHSVRHRAVQRVGHGLQWGRMMNISNTF